MSTSSQSAENAPIAAQPAVPAPASLPWRRAAFILAGAAQLITVSALVGVHPPPVTWASLLLAIAPAPLGAATVFTRPRMAWLAAITGAAVTAAGIGGAINHTGLFFVPALVAFIVAAVQLRREAS
jgi:hypothetical protein